MLHHYWKSFFFQWDLMCRDAGIELDSIPAPGMHQNPIEKTLYILKLKLRHLFLSGKFQLGF